MNNNFQMKPENIHEVIDQFKKWKNDNPDEDWQYDEIFEFINNFSRGEMIHFMNWVVKLTDQIEK